MKKIGKLLRLYVVPIGATFVALAFWLNYRREGSWIWIVVIFLALMAQYSLYAMKNVKEEKEIIESRN